MISRKIISLLVLLLLVVPVVYSASGDYSIPEAIKHISIDDDGSCNITEEIVYEIEGSVNGVYRQIPLNNSQNITNISVETPGYYNTLEILNGTNHTRIKVWLYKDKAKTQKVSDEKVKVIFNYKFNKGVKIYNDIAEFQYMSWGDEWDSKVRTLKTFIKIPGSSSETEYWNNPDTYVTSSKWNDDELVTTVKNIPKKTRFEQRILMPKSYFNSTINAQVIDLDAKKQIEQDQREYTRKKENVNLIANLFLLITGLLMILPAGIYLLYGREPKIDYNKKYEYDLPTDSTPVEVNNIVVEEVGKVNFYAFNAVILDLINRGYFNIVSANSENTLLKVAHKRINTLKDYELDLLKYLGKFMNSEGYISMADISKNETRTGYHNFMTQWKKKVSKSVPDSLIKRYFDNKGNKIFRILSIIMIILGSILFICGVFMIFTLSIVGIVLLIEAIILLSIRNTAFGRWTKEGKEYHDKWMNFKKYLTDYSLINEKPPESVQVWGKYLVYAAALGYANSATSTMKKYFNMKNISYDSYTDNDVILFTYYGGFHMMDSSFAEFQTSDSNTGSSGIGSVGSGGFGGGGGGTF